VIAEGRALALPRLPIEFEPKEHVYTLNGIRLPSVTQLMKPFSSIVYEGVPIEAMQIAADRGTRAHDQVSNFVRYGVLETDGDTDPYVEAFMAFEPKHPPAWLASEYRVYHKYMRFAGTVDLIGYVEPDDGTGVDVVDIKTTKAFHKNSIAIQVSAYSEAVMSHGVTVRRRYGLQLLPDGTFRFDPVANQYGAFLMCINLNNLAMEGTNK
jgi:hypothetical protein